MQKWLLLFIFFCTPSLWAAQTSTGFANNPAVQQFINEMVKNHHFKRTELVRLFNTVKIRKKVIQSIRTPLEQSPWYTYQHLFVTEWRIREGVEFWNKYQTVLREAEKKYGVPASIIVATIGVETKYGKNTGEYPVMDALANISFSTSSRAAFFRQELKEFLLLTREQHLNPRKVMGSYAGAIGQPQFMPSSYRRYAVSYHHHQKIDLSHNEADVIVSIANFYKAHGWTPHQPVALPASLVGNKSPMYFNKDRTVTIVSPESLVRFGLKDNIHFSRDQQFRLIELRNYWSNEYWLSFHNFNVIKRYNPSDLYAMAVFQLSHYIGTLREKTNSA